MYLYIYLLLAAVIMFISILLNRVSGKLGVPALLAFILLGMLFGSDGVFKIQFDNFGISEQICCIALCFIMFTAASEPILRLQSR